MQTSLKDKKKVGVPQLEMGAKQNQNPPITEPQKWITLCWWKKTGPRKTEIENALRAMVFEIETFCIA